MNIKNLQKFLFIFMLISTLILTACGGGGGGSTGAKDDLNKFNTISKTIDSNVVSSVGNLTTNGIQLNVAKNAMANGSKITIKQYSNIGAASAKLSNEFPQLASFTAVSALYEISAVDSKEKTVTTLDNSSELEIQLQEDISSDKLYYSAIKQNNEWDLYPLAINDLNATIRAAKGSRSVKTTINTLYQSIFIACAKKANIPSKLTYAEVFDLKLNGTNDTPMTINALYTQKFEKDIEGKIKLTLKGELTPDKADMNLEIIQKGNKSIYLKKKDNTYKEFTFKTTDEADKYKSKISLTNEFVNTELSGDTAIYTFYVKAKDVKIDDMPSSLIVKAITNGTKPFYSNELQLNFAGGPKQPTASVKDTAPTTEADIKQTIVVAFSEAMNKDAVEKALLIKAGDKNIQAASKSWNKNNTELSIVLQNLSVNTKHSINIGSTALSASGVPLKAFSISFTTKKYLGGNSVTLITPAETTNVNIDTKIVLAFAKPVKFDTSKGSELVTVKTGSTAIGATYTLQNSNKEVVISFNNPLKNSTKYSVSVSDKIPSEDAAYSNVEAKTFEFTTDIKRYTITFNGNGNTSGSVPTVKDTFLAEASYKLPTDVSIAKTGYRFSCWNTKQDGCGKDYNLGSSLIFTDSNITLYAKWIKTYSITFNGNGNTSGTIPTVKETFVKGESYTIPTSSDVIKTGYCFAGWNTKQDGSGNSYKAGEKLTVSESDIVLYAQWSLYNGGMGTSSDPYQIAEAIALDNVRKNLSACFVQTADIDLSSLKEWIPIGYADGKTKDFSGTYDGNLKSISNMTITKDYEYGTGLFAAADSIASISNVVLKNVSIVNNSNYVGAMVGMWLSDSSDNKKVFNCSVSGTITTSKTSSECIGGLIGVCGSLYLQNCSSSCNVTGYNAVGGLIGATPDGVGLVACNNSGTVRGNNFVGGLNGLCVWVFCSSSSNNGAVIGNQNIGGCVGEISGDENVGYPSMVMNCKNYGSISGAQVGGIIGWAANYGSAQGLLTIESCNNYGIITGEKVCGGIISYANYATISNCSNTNAVTVTDVSAGGIGGVVAYPIITDCSNSGAIKGRQYVGGILGGAIKGALARCSNTGTVSGESDVGNLVGLGTIN